MRRNKQKKEMTRTGCVGKGEESPHPRQVCTLSASSCAHQPGRQFTVNFTSIKSSENKGILEPEDMTRIFIAALFMINQNANITN